MKLGTVIGRVTLSQNVDCLRGGRWLLVSPFERKDFERAAKSQAISSLSREFSLVVYDNLGADVGQTIGYEEGREAAQPFSPPIPIDAISVALVDHVFYSPI